MHRRGIGVFFPNANSELTLLLPAHPTENPRFIQRHRSHRVTDNSLNFRETGKRLPDTGFDSKCRAKRTIFSVS